MLAASPGFSFADAYAIGIAFGGLVILVAIAALSSHSDRIYSPAAVYLVLGALASAGLHLLGIDLLSPIGDSTLIEHLTEFAVIIALFGAGLRLDRKFGLGRWRSTSLLILLVMPLTIAAVAAFANLAMGLSLGAAIILGAALAPTDPVLARDLKVGPPGKGDSNETRFALTSEAGLNDGLAFPFIFLGVLVAGGEFNLFTDWFVPDVLYAVTVGIAFGFAGGHLIAWGSDRLRRAGWLRPRFDGWLALAAVLAIYGITEIAGAYGFLAAFAGGLGFRRHEWSHEAHGRVHAGADLMEDVTELGMVLILGSTVTIAGLGNPGLAGWLLVPFLLLLVRPTLTLLAFSRSPVSMRERLLIGWFGIRGVGSFYYAAVAINAGVLPIDEASRIYWTIVLCVGISILVHGFTGRPAMASIDEADSGRIAQSESG